MRYRCTVAVDPPPQEQRAQSTGTDDAPEDCKGRSIATGNPPPEELQALSLLKWTLVGIFCLSLGAILAISLQQGPGNARWVAAVVAGVLPVVASLAGAYVGHRLGSTGRQHAERTARVYASKLDPDARREADAEIAAAGP